MIKRKKNKHADASPSYWQTVWRLVLGNKRGMVGLSFLLAMLLVSIHDTSFTVVHCYLCLPRLKKFGNTFLCGADDIL